MIGVPHCLKNLWGVYYNLLSNCTTAKLDWLKDGPI